MLRWILAAWMYNLAENQFKQFLLAEVLALPVCVTKLFNGKDIKVTGYPFKNFVGITSATLFNHYA